jgi:hypothetical protein
MRTLIIVLAAILVTGCASRRAKFEERLHSWEGKDANELLATLGAPTATTDMPNGDKMYTYEGHGGFRSTSSYNQFIGVSTDTVQTWCKTTYIANNENFKIYRASYRGNDCW